MIPKITQRTINSDKASINLFMKVTILINSEKKLILTYILLALVFVFVLGINTGCTSYHLGKSADMPFKTLYIEPVSNRSFAPQTQALLNENLIEAFLRDGQIRIVDESQAETTLRVVITRYDREIAARQKDDTFLGRTFGVTLEVQVSLIDNLTGNLYFAGRNLSTNDNILIDDGLPQSEYQTIPVLTRSLAQKIKNTVISVW